MKGIFNFMDYLNFILLWEFHEKKHVGYNLGIKDVCKLPSIRTTNFEIEQLSF